MTAAHQRRLALVLAVCAVALPGFSALALADEYRFVTKWGSEGSGDGQFASPRGLAVDLSGNVYVADTGNDRVQKFRSDGTFVRKWGSSGAGDGQFDLPHGIATDASGNVYVADTDHHRVQKFAPDGTFTVKWGSEGTGDGQFNQPSDVAVGPSGNVYVTDYNNHRIQKFTSGGAFLLEWGSNGAGDDECEFPGSVAVDSSETVYVADTSNCRLMKFTATGTFIALWDSVEADSLGNPLGIAVDGSDTVYVSDTGNDRVQKHASDLTFLVQWGSQGSGNGEFDLPWGVDVEASGSVYVADSGNHRIQKFSPVPPAPPELSWLKAMGYDSTDGCHPDSGAASSTLFKFKCKLTDADANEPDYVRLVLYRNGKLYKKITMNPGDGSTADGRKYARNLRLSAGNWEYRITAKAGDGADATEWRTGPVIDSGPYLDWAGSSGYTTDGVAPDSGNPNETTFTFKVKYVDHDGDMPTYVKIRIIKDGVSYKKKTMTTSDPSPDPTQGIIYEYSTTLPEAFYTYRFLAADDDGKATGPAREKKPGPTIEGGSGTLVLSGLSSAPTAGGAQVVFSLSADATVSARVLNPAGRPVKRLCSGKQCEAGVNTLLWDAQSDAGLAVPNGTYLVEVVANTTDGSQTRALTRATIQR